MPPTSSARLSLPERYRVVRHLASGGMAGVWEAHDELLGRSVAVKVLAGHLAEDGRARQRFQREARAAAGLSSHAHVVTIYDVGEHDGRTFMVMELMRGGTVGERIRAGRAISDDTALRWLREAAGALDAAHAAGVVHRDIKPANLLLDDHDRLAIADFGIARLAMEDQLTATGQVLGTAAYISPEQARGEPATAASDRYALAVVAFELLTGSKPFVAEHFAAQARAHVEDEPPLATERDPSLPRGVDRVLERGLAKDPEARWATAAGMVDELDRAMSASGPATAPTRPLAAVPPPAGAREGGAAVPPGAGQGVGDTAVPPAGGQHRGDGAVSPTAADRGGSAATRDVQRSGGDGAALSPAVRRRGGMAALAGLAGLVLLAVLAFVLLSGGSDGGRPAAQNKARSTPTATATEKPRDESTPAPTPKATSTPTATATATATAKPTATPGGGGAGGGLARAHQLQLQGFNARQSGNYEAALASSMQALRACGNAHALDPCGYALFEVGAALNALGRGNEAVPYLQRRLNEYGDNSSGEVQAELDRAQGKEPKKDSSGNGGGHGRGNGGEGD